MRVENKRHTNAHQPFTSLSLTEVSIPPSPPYIDVAESVAFTEAIGCGAFSHSFITLLSQ
jgi:hypothetical protein